jgi:hypothetical protein
MSTLHQNPDYCCCQAIKIQAATGYFNGGYEFSDKRMYQLANRTMRRNGVPLRAAKWRKGKQVYS